jgi:hypothetical protein
MVQTSKDHSNMDVFKGAGGLNAVGRLRSALDLGFETLSN